MRLPHGSPRSFTRDLDYRSYSPLLPLFAALLALVVLLLQGNATAAGGATPGIGVIRWGSSFSQASGYDRYSYVDVTPGDADDAGRLSTKSLVYMSGTSVQTSWSTGVSYSEALANNWLLKDANGQYLRNTAYGAYVGDIGNPAYQQRFISNVAALLAANGNEGVHIDDVLMTPVLLTSGVFPAKYPTQQSWENAMVSFIQAVGQGLRSRGYYVLAQAIGYIPGDAPGSNDGTTNARFWSRLAPYVSGLLSEYWEQLPNDPTKLRPSGTSSWTQYWDGWLDQIDAAQNNGADFFAYMYGTSSSVNIMRYGKASFLLKWDGGGGGFIYQTTSGDPWNLEWTMDIGQPSASRYQVGVGWRRNYSGGTVILNPSPSTSQTFALGGTYTRPDGTAVSSVTLGPVSALILKGQSTSTPTPPPPVPSTPPAPTGTSYLSDLNWASMTNGWGPAEQDRSNGEQGASDGHTLTLNGTTYAKGLGAHSNSDVRYALGTDCTRFKASVGVDDESFTKGSVAFRVFADANQVYDSGVVSGSSATKTIDVSIAGASQLRLVVTNGGDNFDYDHADWAMARIECGSGTPSPPPPESPPLPEPPPVPSTPPAPTGTSYLSDLNWASMTNGWGPAEQDRSNGEQGASDGHTLTLNGTTYAKGLGAHSNSDVRYALGTDCTRFKASVGVDDESFTKGSVAFRVFADANQVYDSGVVSGSSATKTIDVSIAGASQLRLVVTNGGDNFDSDHADWAMARIECGSGTPSSSAPEAPPLPAPPPVTPAPATPPTTPTGTSYLSDLNWASMTNGWGPAENDRSNGELGATDGHTLTLNGTTYAKGLGVHSVSDLRYALGPDCTRFKAAVGIDDEAANGSVTFQVFADGNQVFDSGLMTGTSSTKSVDVSIAGASQLRLVVTSGGDNLDHDHADWALARIECG